MGVSDDRDIFNRKITKQQRYAIWPFKNYRQKLSIIGDAKKELRWMYAIVKLNVDNQNKVTGFKVINEANTEIKQAFGFLINFKFPKKTLISGRLIVFYLAVDNLNGCTEKPGDKVFYAPNDAAATLWKDVSQTLKAYPNAFLIPGVFIYTVIQKHSHKENKGK